MTTPFPSNPAVGEEFTRVDTTWVWSGVSWNLKYKTIKGDPGEPGPPGEFVVGDVSYTHEQGTPASVWTVQHNLGYNPAISITDSGGSVQYGEIRHLDHDTVEITFLYPFGGKAFAS